MPQDMKKLESITEKLFKSNIEVDRSIEVGNRSAQAGIVSSKNYKRTRFDDCRSTMSLCTSVRLKIACVLIIHFENIKPINSKLILLFL